jgi:hypothetical protein
MDSMSQEMEKSRLVQDLRQLVGRIEQNELPAGAVVSVGVTVFGMAKAGVSTIGEWCDHQDYTWEGESDDEPWINGFCGGIEINAHYTEDASNV